MIPRPGLRGRLRWVVQRGIGRVLKAERDRVLARQGLLNELLLAAMEFQQATHRQALRRLEERIVALEGSTGNRPRESGS